MKSGFPRPATVRLLSISRDRDEPDATNVTSVVESRRQFVAIHHGKAKIQKRNGGTECLRGQQRGGAIVCDTRLITLYGQGGSQHLSGVDVVVHDQHAWTGSRGRSHDVRFGIRETMVRI